MGVTGLRSNYQIKAFKTDYIGTKLVKTVANEKLIQTQLVLLPFFTRTQRKK